MKNKGLPPAQGMYDPQYEHDACGVGFVVNMKGKKSHDIVKKALQVLMNLVHRGACGCEANTGDGAGILMQIPHKFYLRDWQKDGFKIPLPQPGHYGTGCVFMPPEVAQRLQCQDMFEQIIREEGQAVLGWRNVPQNNSMLGQGARDVEPDIRQIFIGRSENIASDDAFERKLFLIRKRIENAIANSSMPNRKFFYIPSLSCRTMIFKGMLNADQIESFYPDLTDPDVESALALVHQRFSTNTFPTWDLAHPFRYLAHNGEINTLRGNVNWMRARQALFETPHFTKEEVQKLLPVINEKGSDSACLDNALEMLVMCGRSLPHAMMMLIPEAWSGHETMSQEKKDFYEFHACMMEPWDGPASVAFTDGKVMGAVLDRNGLRPSRYYVTKDDLVIMASEVGVLPEIPAENVVLKGRLQPGKMFLIDLAEGRIIDDVELKHKIAAEKPYGTWLKENLVSIEDLPEAPHLPEPDHATVFHRQQAFGYTVEDLKILMPPMAINAEEALGSMGTDTPLAVLSDKPQPLYNYFKQLFAQVTNPPLDAIREELVTSVETTIGPEGNILNPGPECCKQIKLHTPILDNDELAKLRHINVNGYKSVTLPMLFKASDGGEGLRKAIEQLCEDSVKAINDGYKIIILSDRGVDKVNAPVPALLATAGVHHHLVRNGMRTKVGLIVESGEPREVHHFALLIGYGAGAINPYLVFETFDDMIRDGLLPKEIDHKTCVKNFNKAVKKGVVKVMSKMGISTVQSYRGAQIFEAIGLNKEIVDKYFTGTASRIEGVGFDVVARETLARHERAYPTRDVPVEALDIGGQYQWRRGGEYHLFNPDTVHKLQYAVRTGNYKTFKEYSKLVDDQARNLCTLRGLFEFKFGARPAVPLSEVEPASEIVKRFATGAMSYGSISKEAHENLAIAMNRIGGKSNTGEGGEDYDRFIRDPNGDWRNSAIKQVASARFGVTSMYLVNSQELQIKMAQGAKPGEGGQLPAHKVYPWIAKTRHATPNVGLISPPPHHDIYSIEDLAQLIFDLKQINPEAMVSVKLVSGPGVGTIAAGVAKAYADLITISGHDGGTGASPVSSIRYAGTPWELGLSEAHQTLRLNDLRQKVRLQVDGGFKTGLDVVKGAILGAESFGFGTAPMIALGCKYLRICHLNNCATGVATQDERLREQHFHGLPERAMNFFRFVAEETRHWLAHLGVRSLGEVIGRTEYLEALEGTTARQHRLNLKPLLSNGELATQAPNFCVDARNAPRDRGELAQRMLDDMSEAIEHKLGGEFYYPIQNHNRSIGARVSGVIAQRWGNLGMNDAPIVARFSGAAGQSFGAWNAGGLHLYLEGDANDGVGKGMAGGRIVVAPPSHARFVAREAALIGNACLYGATGGELFAAGRAGERFAVRNSGATAVVEGAGDHCCEYMTGGVICVLGRTGLNFGAGFTGGFAYVLDLDRDFVDRYNHELVDITRMKPEGMEQNIQHLRWLIQRHGEETGSEWARELLEEFRDYIGKFWLVKPKAASLASLVDALRRAA